jgi:hypothetical protein
MPAFLRGVNYLSPVRYAVHNLAPYSLRHIIFTCDDSQRLPDGQCPITTGQQVLDLYKLNANPSLNIAILGVTAVIYRLLAYMLLKLARTHWGDRRQKTTVWKGESGANVNQTGIVSETKSASG